MNQVIDLRAFADPASPPASLPTLVLIDLQQEYLAPSRATSIPDAEAALGKCRTALAHARTLGMPVAFTRWIGATACDPSARLAGWIPGFEPHGSDSIFEHKQPSCYTSQLFAEVMGNGNGNLVIAGFAGEAACLSTVIDAFHHGHRVTYLADASASHGLSSRPAGEVHASVRDLMGVWAAVMLTESWIKTTSRAITWKARALKGIQRP